MIRGDTLPGFEGASVPAPPGESGWGIIYNSAISSPGRIYFTLGHEFGHYLLHRIAYPKGFHRLRPSRHLVTAPSHRSCDLLLKATRGVTIAVVSSRERKRRQPGLATDDPAFVGWHQLVRGIQGY